MENIQALAVAGDAKHVAQPGRPASQLISESWEKIESWPPSDDTRAGTTNLENELISSISIEVSQPQLQQQQELQEHISTEPSPVKKKRKRSLARRLYRLIKGGGGGGSSKANSLGQANYSTLGSTSSSDYSNNCTVSGVSYEHRYFASDDYCDQSYQNCSRQVAPLSNSSEARAQIVARYPATEQANQLISLTRPESIYLWPNNSQQQIVPMMPSPVVSTSTNPFYPQQQQCSSPIAMISYNHAEAKDYAIALHAQLEQLGVSTYLDLYHIGKGQDWQDSLNGAILNCSLFIPLVTPSYGETLWTSRECKLADVLAKRIIPVNFGQKWPPPSLAIQLATLQYIDWLHTDLCQSPPTPPSPAAAPPLVQTSATVNCQNELKQQQQQLLSQSTSCSRQLQKSMSWPSQYVETVARQLKLSIQSELNSAASQNAVASGQLHHKATTATTNRAIEQPPPAPPSPQSDSGFYEEMPVQLARPPEPAPIGAAANQMSAKVATVAPTRKTGTTVRPETIESSRAAGAGRFSRRGSSKLRVCTRASLKDCNDTEPIMTACPKGASPPVLSYGALERVDAFGSGELSPTYSQSSSSDEPNLVVMPGLESNGFRLKSTRVSNNKDKDKTRAPPATNCNSSSRGTRESHDCDGDYDNTYEIIGCQEDNSIESSEREQVIKKHSHGHVSIKRMARKKSIGHHAKKVLSWIKRPSVA